MKETGPAVFLPQWTKFVVTNLTGRDPLGLARFAAYITDYVMPGIVVTTDRARYFALYAWALWNLRSTEAPKTDGAFEEGFQRRETAFAIATLLNDPKSSPVGKRAVNAILEKDDSEIRTGFRVLPSNHLGGYGQYYSGSMYTLLLTERPEGGFDQVTRGRGERLAKAIEATIQSTAWARDACYRRRRTSRKTLESAAERLGLDAIRQDFARGEREALTDVFFGLDSEERDKTSMRRQSLGRLLDIVRAYKKRSISVGEQEGLRLDDQVLLGPAYFGCLVEESGKASSSYEPPPFLALCNSLWRQFCLHELLSWSLESLLNALLSTLEHATGGVPLDRVIQELVQPAMVETIKELSGSRCRTPRELLLNLGVDRVPTSATCQTARHRFSLKADLNELSVRRSDVTRPAEVVGRALTCLALLYAKWRDGSDDEGWRMLSPGQELAARTVLPRLDSWLSVDATWAAELRALLELLLSHHDRIMYEKGRLDACWVSREEDRLVHEQDYPLGYPAHASRLRAALGVLDDLGVVRKDSGEMFHPTKSGESLLAQVQEIGR